MKMKLMDINAHSLEVQEVVNEMNTSLETGLSEEEVNERIDKYGLNEIKETKKISALEIFINQFKDFLIYLLFFAIAISIIVGFYELSIGGEPTEFLDALVIFIILVINAILGFYQEYKAEKALESLKKMAPHSAKVKRDGIIKEVDVKNIVPGDVLQLDEGDKIPADARLVKSFSLYVDEAILTGESQPVEKNLKLLQEKTPLADRNNMIYSNTIITRGNGEAIAVSTGMQTEVGKIAESIQAEEEEPSPFHVEVEHFGRSLGKIIMIICLAVFLLEFFLIVAFEGLEFGPEQIERIVSALTISISLAVSAVPEGLVVVITVVMSIGMRKMADRNALVKTLTAVETLGRVNVICSDKTGTLTRNEMTVVKVFLGGDKYDVTGVGYKIEGDIVDSSGNPVSLDSNLKRFLQAGMFCNNSSVNIKNEEGDTDVVGDPTEICLKVLALKMNLDTKAEKLDEIPFNSDRKMMSVVVDIDGQLFSFIKGAPDVLMKNAAKGLLNGDEKPFNDVKDILLNKNEEFAKNALRVLGLAYKPLNEGYDKEEIEKDYIYLGLAGIIDPARDEVKHSIEQARMAGIRTIMITGDHKITAIAIAKQIGLTDSDDAITGAELDKMSDEELADRVAKVDVFARVTSEDKLRILKILKAKDYVVSMTGDGVNDAPAVKGANVGVAMGLKGTEVTQEASDMILIDDNYATIVNAIEEGRGIFETTKGFFRYMLSTNFDEIFLIVVAFIVMKLFVNVFLALPITPIQILWLNIATDGIPAMVLGLTPTDPDVMKEEPRKGLTLTTEIKGPVFLLGIYTAITDVTVYLVLWLFLIPYWSTIDPMLASYTVKGSEAYLYAIKLTQTIIFTNLVMCELMFVFTCTSNKKPFWKFPNRHLFWAVGISLLLQFLLLYTPLNIAFGLVPLTEWYHWMTVFIGAVTVPIFDELRKFRIRIKERKKLFK
jgi:Ca2+-transporting ATPase